MVVPESRRDRIHDIVAEHGSSTVADLAEELGVSAMTIRRDLAAIDGHGIRRTRGGAVAVRESPAEHPARLVPGSGRTVVVDERVRDRFDRLAAEHITDGNVLMWRAIDALIGDLELRISPR